ncbi:hypothetical protein JC221_030 [Yersinia phage JC221]|nr:hypothetical protein JC221_030 [Yersinia phage JC221]
MDIDFIYQYLSLIERPIKTKTYFDMLTMAKLKPENPECPLNPWTDKEMAEIRMSQVEQRIYAFMRDNRELF